MTPDKLIIDGDPDLHKRFRVYVDVGGEVRSLWLRGVDFKIMAILALHRMRLEDPGWVHKSQLVHPVDNANTYIGRMCRQVHGILPELGGWPVVENMRRHEAYRLAVEPESIAFTYQGLRAFGDGDLDRVLDIALRPRQTN